MYVYNYIGSDHAICKAQNCISIPVEFEEEISVGDIVYAFGYPNDAFLLSSTEGTVTATNVVDGTKTYIENTAKIDHGSSGGILANSKGKVIGITTGILENNKYAALSYSEIKSDVTKNHFGTKEPLEWFHTKKEVSLNTFNFDTYFNISVTPTPLYGGSIRYDVSISLKPIYQYKKVDIKYTNLYFSIKIDTDYEYYSPLTYGGGWKATSSLCYAYIYMYNQSDLYWKSSTANSSFFYSNYSKLYYDYDYDNDYDDENYDQNTKFELNFIIIDMKGKTLLQTTALDIYDNMYLVKNNNKKMVLLDKDLNVISGEYDKIITTMQMDISANYSSYY